MDERNIFDALEASNNQLGQEEEHYEAESGTDTDEEEGQYTFLEAVNQSLAAEELSSDEEYVLTELGPVIHRFEESEATPTTSTNGQHTPDEVVDRSTPDVHQVLNDLQEVTVYWHWAYQLQVLYTIRQNTVQFHIGFIDAQRSTLHYDKFDKYHPDLDRGQLRGVFKGIQGPVEQQTTKTKSQTLKGKQEKKKKTEQENARNSIRGRDRKTLNRKLEKKERA
ncbi:hypothetical protein EGW08_013841 [Elysia chlorotica]|uniref:Uncharacterized protein n=1 Tax=Elysia chlorotica TaxID=188477 RepID=A0A3S0ZMG2_ELYCH|nr:hypothetical protein EGW08_013841 [Elysia chlorotica]